MAWNPADLNHLKLHFEGNLYLDDRPIAQLQKRIFSSDASVYEVKPQGVAIPQSLKDLKRLIQFAHITHTGLIPRAAGTSLAGQVVGSGMVVEISKNFQKILQLNKKDRSVWVEPGIIRDDLNQQLAHSGLFFGPETSTSSRALIGGMLGNNSCGLHSIVWGNTRDHLLETRAYLSDGTEIHTHPLSLEEFYRKTQLQNLEGEIYRCLHRMLNNPSIQDLIRKRYPKASIKRRNTGYALDALLEMQPFQPDGKPFNLSALLAGSEGTLAMVHSIKLQLLEMPAPEAALVCIHCGDLIEAMHANVLALQHEIMASELVDDFILGFTEGHPQYQNDRGFIEGQPKAILMVELRDKERGGLEEKIQNLINDLKAKGLGYAHPVLLNQEMKHGWDIRKAGLGLIRNQIGAEQAVNLIEDVAVDPLDLPAYVQDIQALLAKHQTKAAFYAHAGAGELHIEPLLDLSSSEGKRKFRQILDETCDLVIKYQGALSGEHGDGRLRGEFIPKVMGQEIYQLFQEIKSVFDPKNIFNPGKIVDTPAMDEDFRIRHRDLSKESWYFHYEDLQDPLQLAEKCSGSGDCKKSHLSGGTMCPSYMASLNEKDSTRARANTLRQLLNESGKPGLNDPAFMEVMDLCLSCKACKTECPSGVDIGQLKAESLQHRYDMQGIPWKSKLIGHFPRIQKKFKPIAPLYNLVHQFPGTAMVLKKILGFAPDRSLPALHRKSVEDWFETYRIRYPQNQFPKGKVVLFVDEFSNYNDVELGKHSIQLLNELGYGVILPKGLISGRSYLSKGMLKEANTCIQEALDQLLPLVDANQPLLGIEPSALLTFKDEALHLGDVAQREKAKRLSNHVYLMDEFLAKAFKEKQFDREKFTDESQEILLHGHCHQKALIGLSATRLALEIPKNYKTKLIPSGCCGMAGSFGYEQKNYELSQKIAQLVLYPSILAESPKKIVAANGTSCRHQLEDGLEKTAYHTVDILYHALKQKNYL